MNTTTTTAQTIETFKVGETYTAQSAGNSDCIWYFTIIARTAKFITYTEGPDTRKVGVKTDNGEEWALPFGTYSMAPVIRATRTVG